jgi:steroid delta-isomerase-like uncharacterized protein
MTPSELKGLADRFLQTVFAERDLASLPNVFTSDAVIHDPGGAEYRGADVIRRAVEAFLDAFPDLRFDVEDRIAENDRVAIRFRAGGTHRGEFRGVAPTGKAMSYTGVIIIRFEDGKIAEYWGISDVLSILEQLGAIRR